MYFKTLQRPAHSTVSNHNDYQGQHTLSQ